MSKEGTPPKACTPCSKYTQQKSQTPKNPIWDLVIIQYWELVIIQYWQLVIVTNYELVILQYWDIVII